MSPTTEIHPLSGGAHLEALLANLGQLARSAPDIRLVDGVDDVLTSGTRAEQLSDAEREKLEVEVRRLCFLNQWFDVLARSGAPTPYNYRRPFPDNAAEGPADGTPLSGGVDPHQRWNLLGRSLGYPIGVPASVLTANRNWVCYFARQGFNVLTFKTVRSRSRPVLPFPNWVYLEDFDTPIAVGTDPAELRARATQDTYLRRLDAYSTANSFGVPSREPDEWQPEVEAIIDDLPETKLLIVSVMGMYEDLEGAELVADFVDVALRAEAAGAHAVELNLSCPNSAATGGGPMLPPISESPELVREIVGEVRSRLSSGTPLVAKLSYLRPETLEAVVAPIADEVQGVAGINTLQIRVEGEDGTPIFKKLADDDERNREFAGVSGIAIRDLAQHFVLSLHRLRRAHGWTFDILGMGGVMGPHDVRALMALGADAVQTATCASTNPRLPQQLLGGAEQGALGSHEIVDRVREALLDAEAGLRSPESIADELGLDIAQVEEELAASPDLPARISKLVWLSDLHLSPGAPEPALRDELWGREPSEREALSLERAAQNARAAQWLDLVEASSPLPTVSHRTGTDEEVLAGLAREGRLLSFRHLGSQLFPDWQFAAGLSDPAMQALSTLASAFAGDLPEMHKWMTASSPDLGRRRPASVFARGSFEDVVAAAEVLAAAGR